MKKTLLSLSAVFFAAMGMMAAGPVASTRVVLSPETYVETDAAGAWVFQGGYSLTNGGGKSYASVDAYTFADETVGFKMLKMSKDVEFNLNIPDGYAVVKIAFNGVSNSTAGNWAYLCYINNTTELPIYSCDRDIMDNEAIKALPYPFSPECASAYNYLAEIQDEKGWFTVLNFLYDGNNQVAANITLWVVPEADIDNYKIADDPSMATVKSTVHKLCPDTYVETTAEGAWMFEGGLSLTNGGGKSYASVDCYKFADDSVGFKLLKMSKDVEFNLNIPDDQAVVKIAFNGVSNSTAGNWAYLCYINNTTELPIYSCDRDSLNNEFIQTMPYPFSPEAASAYKYMAVIEDELGWFSVLNFLYDGNNQVAVNITVWTVPADQIDNYSAMVDPNSALPVIANDVVEALPAIKADQSRFDGRYYNLYGQEVTSDYKGIVIHNGKKFLNR